MSENLPCAHCGGEPAVRLFGNTYYVYCAACGITTGGEGHTKLEAAQATWNERVSFTPTP